MNVYISHSSGFDYQNELYKLIQDSGFFKLHKFIFPHLGGVEQFKTKDLFALKNCDLVIAEISHASTGQGIELGWAQDTGIKIICIYKKDAIFSSSLKLVCKDFIEYTDSKDMVEKLSNYLK